VVLATHSDVSLALLGAGATPDERDVLSAIPYNSNDVYLHTDEALMPVGVRRCRSLVPVCAGEWCHARSRSHVIRC
jgi:predicted NAD/FAD-binding protein